ncbi:hypothetical protein pb186bvf_007212 [Paramecium bursaria]
MLLNLRMSTQNDEDIECELELKNNIIFIKTNVYEDLAIDINRFDCVFEWLCSQLKLHILNEEIRLFGEGLQQLQNMLIQTVPHKNFTNYYRLGELMNTSKEFKVCHNHNFQMYKCKDRQSNWFVAKVYQSRENDSVIFNEIQVYRKLRLFSNYSLQLEQFFIDKDKVILVFEYCTGGTLLEYLQAKQFQIDENQINQIMRRLIKATKMIHSIGLMHRDLKLDNIMFRQRGNFSSLIFIDFAYAAFIEQQPYIIPRCGTPGFIAPEIFEEDNYNELCDIFSLGAIFHILLSGKRIYPKKDNNEFLLYANEKSLMRISNTIQDSDAKDLLQLMLQQHNSRPSAQDCLNHVYFNKSIKIMTMPCFKNPFKK